MLTVARFWLLTRIVAARQVQTLPSQGFWSRSGNRHLHNFTGNYVIMVVLGATRKSIRYFGNIKPRFFPSFFWPSLGGKVDFLKEVEVYR